MGTKEEVKELSRSGKTPPLKRVKAPVFPGPGYAVALHGNMVVHRAAPLKKPAERITMVNGFVSMNCMLDDQSRTRDLIGIDSDASLFTEWARHASWRTQRRLKELIDIKPFNKNPENVVSSLESALEDIQQTIVDMKSGPREAEHYEM